ncbi:MAG TPA: hypothetical protein VGB05_10230, partial [Pyrinomonadaceae bacterium]
MRFSQVTRFTCACALVFSSLTPLHASGFSDDTRAALMHAPLSHDQPDVQVVLTAEATAMQETQAATTTARKRPNLFVRIISAPFRGLAKLFGGGGEKGDKTARAKTKEKQKKEMQTASANQPPGGGTNVVTRTEPATVASPPETLAGSAALSARAGERVLSVPPTPAASPSINTPSVIAAPPPPSGADKESFDYVPRPFTPFIEGVPGDPLSQGRALLANGYTNEAVAELSVAAVTGPDLVEANNLLGLAYDRRGQHKQAREFYERA